MRFIVKRKSDNGDSKDDEINNINVDDASKLIIAGFYVGQQWNK
jgi:hypothetical protein